MNMATEHHKHRQNQIERLVAAARQSIANAKGLSRSPSYSEVQQCLGPIQDALVAVALPTQDDATQAIMDHTTPGHRAIPITSSDLYLALLSFVDFDGRYAGGEKMDTVDFHFNLEALKQRGREALAMARASEHRLATPPAGEVPTHYPLNKTAIVIWSRLGRSSAAEQLVNDIKALCADEEQCGHLWCSGASTTRVENPATDPDWDGTDYFIKGDAEDARISAHIQESRPRWYRVYDVLSDNSLDRSGFERLKLSPHSDTVVLAEQLGRGNEGDETTGPYSFEYPGGDGSTIHVVSATNGLIEVCELDEDQSEPAVEPCDRPDSDGRKDDDGITGPYSGADGYRGGYPELQPID